MVPVFYRLSPITYLLSVCGDVAQLGEHLVCNQDVAGSIPVISTKFPLRGNLRE